MGKQRAIIIGDGGLAKEVAFHLIKNNRNNEFLGFVGFEQEIGTKIYNDHSVVIKYDSKIHQFIEENNIEEVYIGVSNNKFRFEIFNTLKDSKVQFPNIIDSSVYFDEGNAIGLGNLILHGCHLTCNIKMGNFNILNGMVGIGHDVEIKDFNYLGPSTNISGCVKMGSFNTIHLKSSIIQNRSLGDFNTVNMYSVVINNLKNGLKLFGIPAKKHKEF